MKPGLFQKILFLIIVFGYLQAAAQPAAKIYGVVRDQNNAPLSWVTISLLQARDSSLARTELTDEKGRFEMPSVHAGTFLLCYAAVGFETFYSTVIELSPGQSFQATPVSLNIVTAALQEVRVISKKPLVEVKPGKTVFNVQNSITGTGSHALELLQKLPGIRVDNNDNIS
ncbi:MAG TPA: carboxypeptidase-like regulatory domain-containing protein, partial [Chitinophagaceae bacterium]|nr:carboxypeptidase-like regulatory domain-containing protein [Chitinophagaceae bacterium]